MQKLWEMGYRVIPFPTWGAAESLWVDPTNSLVSGVNDSRKGAGKAVAY